MKNKRREGISLIVLIITIIVIVILAGAVIVSLASNNLINEATEAKYKQDLKSLNERAQTSLLTESVHDSSILTKTITDKDKLYLYIPELKGTPYEDKTYITKGEIILRGAMLTKEEIKWAKEIYIKIDNLPVIDSLVLTSTETEVTAVITILENKEVVGYRYQIQGIGASNEWVDSIDTTHTFSGLKPGEEYIVEAVAYTNNAESIVARGVITTAGVSEMTQIETLPTDWTNDNVTVTITHESKPAGYTIQYKVDTGEWQDYTVPFMQSDNARITARIYNKILADEIGANSKEITNIDKTAPTLPAAINIVSTEYNSITVQAEGSTDVGSGIVGYEYSIDGTNYSEVTTDSYVISNVKAGASVTVYARAKDKVGLVSDAKSITTATTGVSEQVSIVTTPTTWINGSVSVTLSHSNIPSGYVMQYKLGAGNWVDYSSAFSQGENIKVTARLYHVSLADEIAVSSSNITNIDKIAPTIPTEIAVVSTDYNSITVQAEGSTDVGSGLVGYEYSTEGTNYSEVTTDSYVISNVKAGASVTVYARAKDKVGLLSAVKTITTSSTGVSEQVRIEPNTTAWTNTATITLSHSNIPSGYVVQYKQATGEWINYSTPFSINSNMKITARLYLASINDEIGVASKDITNIATTAPTKPTVNLNGYVSGSWTNANVTQSFSSTDSQSGVSYYQYSHDGASGWTTMVNPWIINFDGQWNFYIRAVDLVGNVSVNSDMYTVRRDATGPTVSSVTTTKTHNSITVNAVATDSGVASISGYQYYLSSIGVWSGTEGASKTYTGLIANTSYTVYVRAVDSLGNIGAQVGPYAVTTDPIPDYNPDKGVNKPQLAPGMTPIKWVNNAVVTTTEGDPEWYNYTNKQWANAQTADGSMWVWIPRYIYKIPTNYWHQTVNGIVEIQFSKETNDDWNSANIGFINRATTANASNATWTNHPAFTFGGVELNGLWVAKFEASAASDNRVQIRPGIASLRSLRESTMFDMCRQMETNGVYGWGTTGAGIDTHQMKNTEWGCVAYLSSSQYGLSGEKILGNGTAFYYTGGGTFDAYLGNIRQATTGNVNGIYDMSGGAFDCVAAYVDNGNSILPAYSASLINADAKYKDVYMRVGQDTREGNYIQTTNKKGDAVFETSTSGNAMSSWYQSSTFMPSETAPLFIRGNYYAYATNYAGIFNFQQHDGNNTQDMYSFRPTLLVSPLL